MSRSDIFVNLIPAMPVLLAHLAGVVVALVLLIRQEGRPISAVFGLIGFGLLFILDLVTFARGPVIRQLLHQTGMRDRAAVTSLRCCCGFFDVVAIVCLIFAIGSNLRASQTSSRADSEGG